MHVARTLIAITLLPLAVTVQASTPTDVCVNGNCDAEEDSNALLQSRTSVVEDVALQASAIELQQSEARDKFYLSMTEKTSSGTLDPFSDVPSEWTQNAARHGINFLSMPPAESPTSLVKARREIINTKDEASLKRALTSVECKGPEHKISCSFKNLYFNKDAGGFFVFSLQGSELPDFHSVLLLHKWSWKGSIKNKVFASLHDVGVFFDENQIASHDGLSMVYDSIWHFNIGHAIWDGLYPAFHTLCEWNRQSEKYRSVVGIDMHCNQAGTENGKCMSEGVFEKFGGGEFLPYNGLEGTGWHRFDDALAGSGGKGQRSINKDYALPGGREFASQFRDRMHTSHGLPPPTPRTEQSLLIQNSAPSKRHVSGIIVRNKRFNYLEAEMLQGIAAELSKAGAVQIKFIDYGSYPLRANFTAQLELIGQTHLHISGPGTGQAYEPFLGDGSVHVNLGDRRVLSSLNRAVSYLEEVWSEGVDYLSAMYYDPLCQKPTNLDKGEVEKLLQSAIDLAQKGFKMPVPPGKNLSPIGQVFVKYCAKLGDECEKLLSQMNGYRSSGFSGEPDIWWCNANAWAEDVVHENGGWSEAGQFEKGIAQHCVINRTLLRETRYEVMGF